MYVCICNALKDRELSAAARHGGSRTVADVFRRCGKRPQCGRCLPDVAEMIDTARAGQRGSSVAAE